MNLIVKNTVSTERKACLKTIVLISMLLISLQTLMGQTFNINFQNTSLENVLNEIRIQSDINIIYNNEDVSKYKDVSLKVENGNVEQVLKKCLNSTQLNYRIENKTIVIYSVKSDDPPSEQAQVPVQTVRGTIIDRDSKITLPGASIVVLESNPLIGVASDIDGNFKMENVPIGRHDVKVSFIGYDDFIVSEILVGSVNEVLLNIELSESVEALEAFTVSNTKGEAINEMAVLGAQSFSVEETKRYAASIGDPARMVQSFAGVSTGDDASNEIVIRGNSPNWLLWRLEGVEIPSPNHFSEEGGSSGAVSILSTNMLNVSDFYLGAFSSEYGNALSGVFDIRLRNGNNQKAAYSAQIGVLGLEVAAEGPLKKDNAASYLINYRYSTLSILNSLNISISENTLPSYQDLSFKVNLPTKRAGILAIWGIGGLSSTDEKYLPDTSNGEKFKYGYSDYTNTGMYAAGLTHTLFTDSKSYVKTVISSSMSKSSEDFMKMDSLGMMGNEFYDDLQSNALRITSFYNRKISNKITLRGGVILSHLQFKYFTQSMDSTDNWITYLDSRGSTNQYQAYIQSKFKFSQKLLFTAGLHTSYFELNKDNTLEPRLGLVRYFPKKQKISVGFGVHSKNEQLSTYYIQVEDSNGNISMPNKDLDLTRSLHYVLSYEKAFKNLSFKLEVYYQDIPNLPVANNPSKYWSPIFGAASPNDTLENIGKGRNYGLEFTLQKYFSNGYYYMLTTSLFESEYMAADGVWRDTKYNINHILNLVAGKEFKGKKNRLFGLNARVVWTGGKRLIPIDLEASIEEEESVYETDQLWSKKGSDYFRLDLGFKLHFFKPKTEHIVSLDIQNVTNRLNQWTEFYNPEEESIETYPMAGIIPVLSYKLQF